jgi:hypothetical protein
MNFNELKIEQENSAKEKFLMHGVGINMSKYNTEESQKWHDLVNRNKFSERAIIERNYDTDVIQKSIVQRRKRLKNLKLLLKRTKQSQRKEGKQVKD